MTAGRRLAPQALAGAVVMLAVVAAAPAIRRLDPVDEARQQPDFLAFRTELQQTVAKRDVEALLRIVHPQIKNGFGGDDGIAAFRRLWRLDEGNSELWAELGAVLSLGGTFQGPETFVAPYVFSRWPDDLDSFDHVAVVGSGVRVRSGPSTDTRPLESLTFAILRRGDGGDEQPWTPVVLADGRKGFVASRYVRSPVGYRAYFSRAGGRWQMTLLVAGD